jgi:gliding motility-associated-like protein
MKVLLTLILSSIALSVFAQAPVNDDCSGIIDVGVIPFCSSPGQYTNAGATASVIDIPANNIPSCFSNGVDRDVWFQFELPADGSIVDIAISVYGNVGGNGTLKMPEVAIYRGPSCSFGELAELYCAAAPLNVNEVHKEVFNLTPGSTYYLRINDYSATAASNEGTFRLCIEKYVADINIGTAPSTQSCSGTLWDSGGPTGDYMDNEGLTFSICPSEFHQCILLNIADYNIEQGFDYLTIYEGPDANSLQLTQLTGSGANLQIQIPSSCVTIRFNSDQGTTDSGFKITWQCSPDVCTTPPPTTCASPSVIPTLPYTADNLSNCLSGNSINNGPCSDMSYLSGNDYVFSYNSPGDQCIKVTTTGTNIGAGIGIFDQCPTSPGANCIGNTPPGFGTTNPAISSAFLEHPGTYYIVFGSGDDCSPFNIQVDTITCPVVLPNASTCDKALNIGGCSNKAPEIIALIPGAGDPNFIQTGVNQGCFVTPQFNYTFFFFKAQSNGKFGFVVQAADPNEASDIDINVWGPIDTQAGICDHVKTKQPVRSTWTGMALPTGLADINPETGAPVLDDYDCGSPATPSATGDRFVRRLDVIQGKYYVIMMDDYGNAIHNGGISADFTGTTDNVFHPADSVTITKDTAVCAGQSIQLNATGGVAYFWNPPTSLSCINCQSPLSTPKHSISYDVQIAATCKTESRHVNIQVANLNLGPDITVCNDATLTLNPHPDTIPGSVFHWTGSTGLSCNNCPSPTVTGLTTGVYQYICTLVSPQCTLKDTIQITVLSGEQPKYIIAKDTNICSGQSVSLGGTPFAGTTYSWSSSPVGMTSTASNPVVTPVKTTKYYLVASNGSCPVSSIDSVTVRVFQPPVIAVAADTTICNGQSVLLGQTTPQGGVKYSWTPATGLSADSIANPVATPPVTTTYHLVASNAGCSVSHDVTVNVVQLDLKLSVPDTVLLCNGKTLAINATVNPVGTPIIWAPLSFLTQGNPNGTNVSVKPDENITYTATVSLPGCTLQKKVYIQVDSLPWNLKILPKDTTVCQGAKILLQSPIYEPGDFHHISFKWTPASGFLTPDSLYNAVLIANDSVVYYRINKNGACIDTSKAVVNVIKPPQMFITPQNPTICAGGEVTLTVHNSAGVEELKWSPDIFGCSGCLMPTVTPQSTTTYSISGKYKGCPTATSTTVQVNPLPEFNFPSDTKLCFGESVTLNSLVIPNATYSWTSTDPNFDPVSIANPTITPTQNATYFVVATLNGCTATGQVSITVDQATLSVAGDTTICKGTSTIIKATGTLPGTYAWTSDPGGYNSTQALNTIKPDESAVYTVTYTFGDNCKITDNVTVTVNSAPDFNFPSDTKLCFGESITLNTIVVPGATYNWTSTDPNFVPVSIANPTITPTIDATYSVSADFKGCKSQGQVSVQVFKASLSVAGDTLICGGSSTTIKATGTLTGANTSYKWVSNPAGFTSDKQSVVVTPNQTTIFTVTYTYGDNCQITDHVTVNVQPDVAAFIKPAITSLCPGESITLNSANPTPGATYTWSSTPTGFSSTSPNPTVTPAIGANTTYRLKTSFGVCQRDTSFSVTVFSATLHITPADTAICAGESVLLIANGSSTGTYLWSTGAATSQLNTGPLQQSTSYNVTFMYGEIAPNVYKCTLKDSVKVKVNPNFQLKVTSTPPKLTVDVGETRLLTAIETPTMAGYTYSWLENGVNHVGTTEMITVTPTTNGTDSILIPYEVTVVSKFGCIQKASITFNVRPPNVQFPDAFTPNGDSLNDAFRMVILSGLATVEKLDIYDRWGTNIYTSTDPKASWDGKVDGKDAPSDVYIYVIQWRRGDGALKLNKGQVTLLR